MLLVELVSIIVVIVVGIACGIVMCMCIAMFSMLLMMATFKTLSECC